MQIFCYNGLSVIVIAGASLFGKKAAEEKNYLSVGYLVMLVLVCLNGVVLGTWSFSESTQAISLIGRLVGMFDITHRAALWEITGQIFIASALAHISLVRTSGRVTTTRAFKMIRFSRAEIGIRLVPE